MKVYKAPLFFGKPLQDVLLLSDFEKFKEKLLDAEIIAKYGKTQAERIAIGHYVRDCVECFGVEK